MVLGGAVSGLRRSLSPSRLVLSATNPVSYAVHLGIDSVPPNGVDGRGEVFWGEDGLQGYVKGA